MRTLALVSLLVASSALAEGKQPELHIPLEQYQLPNGLRVVLHEDHRLPQVVVDVWFRVGSKDERVKRTGFAHLFEHLMFMGTKNVPNGQFDQIMEAEGGQNNAFTTEDVTNYYESGPSNLLETFLYLEADRLSTLPDDMTRPKVDTQREVVKNERRQSIENKPYGKTELIVPEHLYPVGHPYHHPVIGSHADLTAASVDDVKAFFRQYYVPSNATLFIVGDFKPADARKLVERYFGWMATQPEPPHAQPPPVELKQAERIVTKDRVNLDQVNYVWHSPARLSPGDAAHELLAAVLGGGKSSRLEKALIYDRKLASKVQVDQEGVRYDGTFVISVTAQPGHSAAELEKAFDAELEALDGKRPITVEEVERARTFLETHELEQLSSYTGLTFALGQYAFVRGDAGALEKELLARFAPLGQTDLQRAAHGLNARPHFTLVITPESPSTATGAHKKEQADE